MLAVCFDGELRIEQRPRPAPPGGEALIRTRLAGICKTDLEIARGYMGFRGILGHEFVGVVEQCGDADWIGRRVVGEINCAPPGDAGDPRHHPGRTVLGIVGRDGAMAEYVCLPVANLLEVPASLPDEVAVFTEPLAAAFEVLEQVPVQPADRVLVLGDGKLGLLVAQVLAGTGCHLLAVGRHDRKLRILAERGISVCTADELERRPVWDVVVEATGSSAGFQAALETVRPRGRIVLKTTVADSAPLNLAPLVIHELQVIGSRCGRFAPALSALEQARVDVRPLIQSRHPLRDALGAFREASSPGALKVLLDPTAN